MATTVGTLLIDMAANISRLQSDMQQARSVVTGAAGDMQKAANTARDALGALGVGLSVGGAIASIQQVGKALIEAEASAVKFKAAFTAISGADSVGREMEFVRSTARSLGLDLEAVSSSYIKLAASSRGTSLEGQATRDIFTAVSKAATVLGLSSSEADGALLAISQMMSKGTVQAEELRGQLGERLPGAFQIAARAMGVSTAELGKMLEAGQVMTEDFIPKFIKELLKVGDVSAEASGTAAREFQRVKNEFGDLVKAVADSGAASAIAKFFSGISSGLAGVAERFKLLNAENAGSGFLVRLGGAIKILDDQGGGPAAERLKKAEADLASGKLGMYGRSEAVAARDQARAEMLRIGRTSGTPGGAMEGGVGDDARIKAMAAEAKAVEALRSEYEKFARDLSGQHKDYQKNLTMLQEARVKLNLSDEVYIAQVRKLMVEQGGVKDSTNARTKAETEAEKQAKKLNEAYFEAIGISKDYVTKVREFETLLKTKQITTEQYAAAIKNLAADQQVSKDAVKAAKDETDKLKQAEKERMAVLAELSKMRNAESAALTAQQSEADKALQTSKDETAQIGLSKEALGNLTAQRWDEKAALIEQRIDQLAMVGGLGEEYDSLVKLTQTYRANADEIRKGARLTAIQDEATKAKEAWDKQATDIGNSLTDALMRGFESGKDFGKTFADTLKNLFKTLILKPIIQPIAQNAAGSLMSLLGLGTAGTAGASTGGVAGVANSASALGGIGNLLSGGGGLASLFGAGTGVGGAATTFATSGLGTMLGLSETVGGVGVGLTGAGSSLVSTLSAVPGWGWALAGGVALLGILGKKRGGPKTGGSFSTTGERLFTPSGADSETSQLGQSALAGITDLATQLGGSSAGLSLGLGFDSDPQGTAGNRIASFLRDSTGRSIYDNTAGRDIGRDDAALQAGLGDETAKLILAGLKASNLPASVRDFIAGVDLSSVTSASMDAIIQQAKDLVAAEAAWQPILTDAQIAERRAMGPVRGSNALDGFTALNGIDLRTVTGGDGPPTSLDGFTPLAGFDPRLMDSPEGIGPGRIGMYDKREPRKIGESGDPATDLLASSTSTATSTATISRSQETLLELAREQRDDQRAIGTAQAEANTAIVGELKLMRSAFERINIVATMASVRPA